MAHRQGAAHYQRTRSRQSATPEGPRRLTFCRRDVCEGEVAATPRSDALHFSGLARAIKQQGRRSRWLHPPAAVRATIGNRGFFQIELVFDAPARFVGDLAVAQELI